MKKGLIILFTMIIVSSCIFPGTTNPTINFLMENAVDTLELNDVNYTLDAYVWRDFMPGDSHDHSMYSVTTLFRIDSLAIPSYVEMIEQYVIQNDTIWATNYNERVDSLSIYKIRRGSSGGPEWEINSYVDVVSKVQYLDLYYYLIKRNVQIIMTQ